MPFSTSMPKSILCVCLGNICRSPTAEAVFRQKLAIADLPITVDSAGTSNAHLEALPDSRSQKYAKERGYNLAKHRARQVVPQDFMKFDLILAMDNDNLKNLSVMKTQLEQQFIAETSDLGQPHSPKLATLALLSQEDPYYCQQPVPDPYYGESENFEVVLDQIESSVDAWLSSWRIG